MLKVAVEDFILKLAWCDDGVWEEWQELQSSLELKKLQEDGDQKLQRSKDAMGGKGKGKSPE